MPDDPAAFVGSRLATHDTSSRLALIFSRRFVYDIKISPDRRVARIVWPGDKIEFNEGIIWKTDDRLAAIRAVARGGEWVEVELKASTAFESISDFWAPDSPTLILDIATEPAAPALTPGINAQAQQSGGLMPAPLPEIGPQARRGTSAGAVPISLLAVGAEQTRARSLEEREAELRDFFMKLSEAFGQQDKRLALMVNNREWDNAADELLDRLQKNPGAPESLVWLFLNAEFRYRAMEELAGPPEDTLEAFNLFINQAPENHELAPYAFYRMAEAAGRLKLAPEEIAYITSARSGPPTPFDDLFLLYQARVCIGDGRDWDARKVLWQLVKQYPRSPLRAESEYLLGELEWRQDTDEGRLQGYEHFRSMLDVTTAPLRARPDRVVIVAKALVQNHRCDEARDLLASIRPSRSGRPTPEEGDSWLLLARCLQEEGRTTDALGYYEKAENEHLPPAIRLVAILNLAEAGHMDQKARPPLEPRSQTVSYLNPAEAAQRVYEQTRDERLAVAAAFLLGRIETENDHLDKAVQMFMRVNKDYPQSPLRNNFQEFIVTYFQDAVRQAFERGDYARVVQFFNRNADMARDLILDRPTRDRHAASLLKLGYNEEAAGIWSRLYAERDVEGRLPDEPPPEELMVNLAESLQKSGRSRQALALLDELLLRHPEAAAGRELMIRALCYAELKEDARAIHALEQVLGDKSIPVEDQLPAYAMLADAYRRQQQYGNAELALQRGLYCFGETAKPFGDSAGARALVAALADLYYSHEQTKSAIEVYSEYVNLFPGARDHDMALYRLAELLKKEGMDAKAREISQRLLEDPKADPVYRELAKDNMKNRAVQTQAQAIP